MNNDLGKEIGVLQKKSLIEIMVASIFIVIVTSFLTFKNLSIFGTTIAYIAMLFFVLFVIIQVIRRNNKIVIYEYGLYVKQGKMERQVLFTEIRSLKERTRKLPSRLLLSWYNTPYFVLTDGTEINIDLPSSPELMERLQALVQA